MFILQILSISILTQIIIKKILKNQYLCQIKQEQIPFRNRFKFQNVSFSIKNINMEIKKSNLSVATLNYTGVITSPYEYYQEEPNKTADKSQKKLNQILSEAFHERLKKSKFYTDKFSWNMGTLDTVWKTRHSPFNLPSVGVESINIAADKNKTKQEKQEQNFKNLWQQQKQKDQKFNPDLIKYQKEKYTKQEIKEQMQMCLKFDLLCYQTLRAEYGPNYKQRQQLSFKKAYLDQKLKIQKTIKFIIDSKSDILYFQQSSQKMQTQLITYFQKTPKNQLSYHLVKNSSGKSIILVNKSTFSLLDDIKLEENKKKFLKEYILNLNLPYQESEIKKIEQQFNVNKDSVFAVIDHFVFWNVHLTSKETNGKQLQAIENFIKSLRVKMPAYHIVLGGDFNTSITSEKKFLLEFSNSNSKNLSTVKKKRTQMQPQVKKADINDFSAKDYFFSNIELKSSEIKMLNAKGEETTVDDKALLPNSNHPYDHYIVKASYNVPPFTVNVRAIK